MRVTATVEGLNELDRALDRMRSRLDHAGRTIVAHGLAVAERAAKGNFEGTHPPGFPHVGGNKPNIVTGNLRRSIRSNPVRRVGLASWESEMGPTTVYGRRIELGYPGGHGPGHQRTRPFPYMRPAVVESVPKIRRVAVRQWAKAVAE